MTRFHKAPLITFLFLLTITVRAQQDPLQDFCRRWSHQTTVVNDKLFIHGGYVNYGDQILPTTVNRTNPYLLYADLRSVNDENFPVQYSNLSKPPDVPSVAGGALWADDVNKLFYLFGGQDDESTQESHLYTLWSYDVIFDTWTKTATAPTIADIEPPAYGASATDPNKGVGYYYGGWKRTNESNHDAYVYPNTTAQSDLIIYSYSQNNWRAVSFIDDTPRAEGAMFYIPASDGGMLVYLGGVEQNSNGSYVGLPMNKTYLYDIVSGVTYTQKTSGTPPSMRRRFCGGVSWPEDRSSYNIYLYGGLPPYEEEGYGFNDVWTLSIPSFTWTNSFTADERQHHSASCDVVHAGQMIILGGFFPNSSDTVCDASAVQGQHNLNLGSDNVENAIWYQYLPNLTEYSVPPYLTKVIGGNNNGNATLRAPLEGFSNADLTTLLNRVATTSTRTATRFIPATGSATQSSSPNDKPSDTNVGAIAGGVVGGVVGLASLLALLLCCLRRRRKVRAAALQAQPISGMSGPAVANPTMCGSIQKAQLRDNSYPSPGPSYQQSVPGSSPLAANGWNGQQPPQYYPPPPQQGQQYFPPPPPPQLRESPSPIHEMPDVRSPTQSADISDSAPRRWRTPSAPINEE